MSAAGEENRHGRTVPLAVAIVVVAVEAVWLVGVGYLMFRLVALV